MKTLNLTGERVRVILRDAPDARFEGTVKGAFENGLLLVECSREPDESLIPCPLFVPWTSIALLELPGFAAAQSP